MSKQIEPEDYLEGADDELAPYDDLVSALQAPGSASELADEQQFRTAFRETHATAPVVPLPSRMARRLGAGGTAVIVVAALSSGGVAAALTGNLPDPVQEIAHSVLGAPAPESPAVRRAAPTIEPIPEQETTSPSPEESPSVPSKSTAPGEPRPDKPDRPAPSSEPSQADPSRGDSSSGPDDEPTEPTSPGAVPVQVPAALTMSGSSHLTAYGSTLLLVGRVTASDGQPIADRKVVLQVRGDEGWRGILKGRTDSTGVVAAQTAPVTGLDRYRWRVRAPLRSAVWRVRVKPALSASYAVSGDQTTVSVTTIGADSGDLLSLYIRVRKQPTLVGEARIAPDGTAQFVLPTPKRNRAVVVRLEKTQDHARAHTRLKVLGTPGLRR